MRHDAAFDDWKEAEAIAETMIPVIGRLYRDHGIVTMLHGRSLVQSTPVSLVRAHRRGHHRWGHDVEIAQSKTVLDTLLSLNPLPAEIDVGRLLLDYDGTSDLSAFVRERAASLRTPEGLAPWEPRDIVLYGFGRIGRILARLLVEKAGGGNKYRLRAIVVRGKDPDDLERRANLLRNDSVHGAFSGTVRVLRDESALLINGCFVKVIYANDPSEVDYTAYGIDRAIIIDNTGKWRDRDGLFIHASCKGAEKVILTAPGKGDVPNIVMGVNEASLDPAEPIVSAASCTTNAIVPVLQVLHERYGIEQGHLETVHAYTNDQNLLDNYHKKWRRGRSAALNLVITETGAAKAVSKALPDLAGRLTGNAIRVPTPDVSLVILNLRLKQAVSRTDLNDFLEQCATQSKLSAQIGFTSVPDTVSTDLIGDMHAGVVDAEATQVNGDSAILYVWYDNEYGYSCQVMRLLEHVMGITRQTFP